MDASAGVEAGLEQAVALGRSTGTAACFFINKGDRENADPTAALDALRVDLRRQDRADPAGDRGGRVVRGLRRPRPPQGLAAGGWQDRSRDPDPGRPGRRGGAPARPAPRGRVRGGRRRPDEVPRGRGDLRPRARCLPAQGRQGLDPGPGPGRQRHQGDRPARPARRDRPLPALPRRRGPGQGDGQGRRRRSRSRRTRSGPLLVRVFKTTADPFVGRLTYLRVLSGTLRSQAHVWNSTAGEDERIGQLLLLHGKEQEPIGELKAGEIGAIAKLSVTETGDTLQRARQAARPAAARVPGAVADRRDRAADARATSTRWARPSPACSRRSRPSASSEAPSASRSCGRWARPTPRSSSSGSSASSGRRS